MKYQHYRRLRNDRLVSDDPSVAVSVADADVAAVVGRLLAARAGRTQMATRRDKLGPTRRCTNTPRVGCAGLLTPSSDADMPSERLGRLQKRRAIAGDHMSAPR